MTQDGILRNHMTAMENFNSQHNEYRSFIVKKRKLEPPAGFSSVDPSNMVLPLQNQATDARVDLEMMASRNSLPSQREESHHLHENDSIDPELQ